MCPETSGESEKHYERKEVDTFQVREETGRSLFLVNLFKNSNV